MKEAAKAVRHLGSKKGIFAPSHVRRLEVINGYTPLARSLRRLTMQARAELMGGFLLGHRLDGNYREPLSRVGITQGLDTTDYATLSDVIHQKDLPKDRVTPENSYVLDKHYESPAGIRVMSGWELKLGNDKFDSVTLEKLANIALAIDKERVMRVMKGSAEAVEPSLSGRLSDQLLRREEELKPQKRLELATLLWSNSQTAGDELLEARARMAGNRAAAEIANSGADIAVVKQWRKLIGPEMRGGGVSMAGM